MLSCNFDNGMRLKSAIIFCKRGPFLLMRYFLNIKNAPKFSFSKQEDGSSHREDALSAFWEKVTRVKNDKIID